ncbi:MAG: hypothetical protein B6240_12125 [Desulfobacteraceae bacterium 4572_87]|nr:MAG: hypothetical protein B6240_12125 [Desulfobacteraceae bacterium 4572_87]
MPSKSSEKFCGQVVTDAQLKDIMEIIETFPKLSRTELAHTVCELFSWKRPTGKLKGVECRQFLERLDQKGVIHLPVIRQRAPKESKPKIFKTRQTDLQPIISTKLKALSPLSLIRVKTKEQRQLWYQYIDRYHYLRYHLPFGAQLRYFIQSVATDTLLGCFQFSSPAWMMMPRDQWISWDHEQRKRNLQKIVNNSRFLIFPWVQVKNLASKALALAVKTIPDDWEQSYGYRPVLMETLVDEKRFTGTCYKAANWHYVGKTTGRGRMDKGNKRHGTAIKDIYLYPLTNGFRDELVR